MAKKNVDKDKNAVKQEVVKEPTNPALEETNNIKPEDKPKEYEKCSDEKTCDDTLPKDVQHLSMVELLNYNKATEILLKHYENQVYANEGVSHVAYMETKSIYDRYVKVHNIIFKELEKRINYINA